MDKYFYKQFKRLFELMEIQGQWYKDMTPQLKWVETVTEEQEMNDLRLIIHNRLQAVRKQFIDDLRKKLMIRIQRKVGVDMVYMWLNHIAYIDADGKQSNLYGLHLPKQVTRGQKDVIFILMRARTKNPSIEVNLQIELRQSEEDSATLYYEKGYDALKLTYTLG